MERVSQLLDKGRHTESRTLRGWGECLARYELLFPPISASQIVRRVLKLPAKSGVRYSSGENLPAELNLCRCGHPKLVLPPEGCGWGWEGRGQGMPRGHEKRAGQGRNQVEEPKGPGLDPKLRSRLPALSGPSTLPSRGPRGSSHQPRVRCATGWRPSSAAPAALPLPAENSARVSSSQYHCVWN